MAHNLMFDEDTQRHAMFVLGDRDAAWHKLGQRVDSAVSWESAMQLAGLDWTVQKHQLLGPDARPIEAWGIFKEPNRQFLGAVGAQYTPIQNRYAFDFVDTLLEAENGAHYDSAGALGNGERIWVSAKVPYNISIRGTDDITETYLIFATSHDGSMAATGKLSTVRVVCNNTLTSALNGSGSFVRVKHTPDAERRLSHAKRLMSGVSQSVKTLEEKFNLLAVRRMTRESMNSVLDRLFPKPDAKDANTTRRDNILADILHLYESNDRNAIPEIRGTAYNLLNAVTEYTDHIRTARITENRKGYSPEQARAENAMFGTGEKLKQTALEVILENTQGNPTRPVATYAPLPFAGSSLLDSMVSQMN